MWKPQGIVTLPWGLNNLKGLGNGVIPGTWKKGVLWRELLLFEGCSHIEITLYKCIDGINTTDSLSSVFPSHVYLCSPLAKLN